MAKKKKLKKTAAKKALIKKARTLMNMKVLGKDRKTLTSLAKQYAHGNVSAWLRHAGLNYRPTKNEVIR